MMGVWRPSVGGILGNGLVGVFGFVWARVIGGAGRGVVAACVAATGLWRAVVGRIALRMEGVVASGGGVASWESCGACGRSRHRSASVAVAEAPRSPR